VQELTGRRGAGADREEGCRSWQGGGVQELTGRRGAGADGEKGVGADREEGNFE
jgi:hypothetical protein